MDGAVSSLRQASKVTVSEETGRVLEREGDKICRKIAGRLEDESARLFDRLSAKDRVVISSMSFWCMIEVIVFFWLLCPVLVPPMCSSYIVPCYGKYSVMRPVFLQSVSR